MSTFFSIIKTLGKIFFKKGSFVSFGQFGEDAIINSIFRNTKGFYVDVGAYHPILYSNTYAFYRKGWKGLVMEPNPAMRPLFHFFRPRDIFVATGVGKGEGRYLQERDGAFNRFEKGVGSKFQGLGSILESHGVKHIDFLTVDVEGMDLDVLETHNWDLRPKVILVESVLGGPVQSFLESKNYHIKGIAGATLIFELDN